MNKVGRPSEYKEEYVEKVDEYLKLNQDEVEGVVESENEQTGRIRYERKLTVKLPTIKGFARFLDVNESTLYEWDKKYPAFSKSLSKIKTEQQERLINSGLAGTYNPTIAKLILSSNHGMSEKSIVDQNITGSINLSDLFEKSKKDEK